MHAFDAAVFSLLIFASLRASSVERAIVAAMQLTNEPNYSWSCTVTDDAGTYAIEGRTDTTGGSPRRASRTS